MTSVKDVCTELLPDLDEDIFDYVVGMLEDVEDEDIDDTAEMISGLLSSAEYCPSEEDALELAQKLLSILRDQNGGSGGAVASTSGDMPLKTIKALKIQDSIQEVSIEPPKPKTNTLIKELKEGDEAISKKEQRLASRRGGGASSGNNAGTSRKPKSNKPTALELAEKETAELEAELAAARVASVRERTRLGAYRGSLDATSFTLPNPGGGMPLLEDAACRFVWGRRYGLIGRNGVGKSTLLRAMAARRVGDVPANVTVHYVSQEVSLTPEQRDKTPVEVVVDADIERNLLTEELTELERLASAGELGVEGSKRHGDILSRLDEIGAESAPRRAKELLDNLGFSEELQCRSLSALSGGWRVRTMLAAAIFAKPDLLLLDEPTNHLSILAVMWLARELSTSETWKERIVVLVSHDRHFMDEVCTDCLHVSGAARKLTQSKGNYSLWAKRRKDEQVLFAKEQAKRQEEIDRLREYAGHGFKYGGSSSQITKMSMKAKQADKLEQVHAEHATDLAALQEDIELPLKVSAGGEIDGFVVQLKDAGFGYPGATPARLFRHCEFGITSKSRIVLLGENGNGKTTLVKLITGSLEPSEGEVLRNPHARFALVNQHHADQIDLTMSPLQFLRTKFPGNGSYEHMQTLRGHLSSCGVTSGSSNNATGKTVFDLQNTPASALSGGQRSRVALAAVSFARPHVLVLDEPTNNLDLESVAALADCVKNFEGAVICVSHDQFFVQSVANEAWVVSGGAVKRVESFEAYRAAQFKVLSKGKQKGR
mmetsp:Transcript_8070/g.17383  ORF Transcript_8070/g.17383 Transcript_8070/m.17383 type:complete len:771 (+) Transcript_8070:93-2405(+)